MTEAVKLFDVQRNTKRGLFALADELDDHQKNLDVGKLASSAYGAIGGAMTMVGLGLTPFTFGASSGLVAIGGVLGIGSAGANIGCHVSGQNSERETKSKAEKMLVNLAEEAESVKDKLPDLLAKLDEKEVCQLVECLNCCNKVIDSVKDFINDLIDKMQLLSEIVGRKFGGLYKIGTLTEKTKTILDIAEGLSMCTKAIQVLIETDGAVATIGNVGKAGGAGVNISSTMTSSAGKVASSGVKNTKGFCVSCGRVGLPGAKNAGKIGVSGAKNAGKVGLSGLQKLGVAATGVGLAFDLGGVIYYSMKLNEKKPCEVAENLR